MQTDNKHNSGNYGNCSVMYFEGNTFDFLSKYETRFFLLIYDKHYAFTFSTIERFFLNASNLNLLNLN